MLTDVAFAEDHVKVVEVPDWIEVGSALIWTVTAGGGATVVTVTTAEVVAVPFEPLAVAEYVVVVVGDTETDPVAGCWPIPGSMSTDAAFVDDHVNVADCPAWIVVGNAIN